MIVEDFLKINNYTQSNLAINYKINGGPTTLWDLRNVYNKCILYQILISVETYPLKVEEITYCFEDEKDSTTEIHIPYNSHYDSIIFNLIIERRN